MAIRSLFHFKKSQSYHYYEYESYFCCRAPAADADSHLYEIPIGRIAQIRSDLINYGNEYGHSIEIQKDLRKPLSER